MRYFLTIILACTAILATQAGHALSSDRDQVAVIEADEVEFDFRTGVRTYKGNVVVEQGTLRIRGDKLIVHYKDEAMEKATAWGTPAMFQQRPDGKNEDVVGKGRKIILNQTNNTLTLYTNASLKQGPDTARGEEIVYKMDSDKMTVKGGRQTTKTKRAAAPGEAAEPSKPGRSRIIIKPRKRTSP